MLGCPIISKSKLNSLVTKNTRDISTVELHPSLSLKNKN